MKIAYFTDTFTPTAGITASILTITQGLGSLGHQVLILAPKKNGLSKNILKHKNVKIEYIGSLPVFFNPNLRISSPVSPTMIKMITEFKPDIVHFHTPFLIGIGAIMLGKMLKVPVISTFHSYFMQPEYLKSAGIKDTKKYVSRSLWAYAKQVYQYCQAIITPTHVVESDLKKYVKSRITHVIPTPIDEASVKKVSTTSIAQLKKKYNLKEHVILYVGRLSSEKSIDVLIKSLARVIKQVPEVSLFIVGDGPQKKELLGLVKKLKLTQHIVFVGEVAHDQLLSEGYFQVADIFATASTSETQGISVIEAMYFGLPVVGVKKKGVQELLSGVGLLSKPRSAKEIASNLLLVLSNQELRDVLSKKSLEEFARKYQFSKVIRQYETLYKNAVSKNLRYN